jgi:hypothetical protein
MPCPKCVTSCSAPDCYNMVLPIEAGHPRNHRKWCRGACSVRTHKVDRMECVCLVSCGKCGRSLSPRDPRHGGKCRSFCGQRCRRKDSAVEVYGPHITEALAGWAGFCDLCGERSAQPRIDHDHETGMVRGILCPFCNSYEGFVRSRRARGFEVIDTALDAYLRGERWHQAEHGPSLARHQIQTPYVVTATTRSGRRSQLAGMARHQLGR